MSLNFKFIPLTFITDENEIKKQIRNTVILRYFFDKNDSLLRLKDVIEGTQYGYNASALQSGKNKFLRISDITDGKVNWNTVPFCDCDDEKTYLLYSDDLLIARTGGTTGKSFLISDPPANSIYAGYLIRIRANDSTSPEFLNLFLNSYAYWSQIVSLNEGEFRPSVNANKLKDLILPECNSLEQIDAINISKGEQIKEYADLSNKIEVALKEYDNCKSILTHCEHQRANTQLLKQSILQEAIQGKLTADWRKKNSPPLEEYPKGEVVNTHSDEYPKEELVDTPDKDKSVKRNSKNYFSLPYNPKLKERAKALRKAGNLSEVLFWNEVKQKQFKGLDFDRQKIIGNYIVDFYCPNCQVVVEIDGSSHDDKQEYDAQRDEYLKNLGLTVIHITDLDIKKKLAVTMNWLLEHPAFEPPRPADTPPKEGNWEPASELLARIKAEKAQLIKEGKIKKEKPLPPITDDEIPFELPEGWVWCRLGEVIELLSGQDFDKSLFSENSNEGIPYLTGASNLQKGRIILNRWTKTPKSIARKGDLLLTCKGSGVGKMAFLDVEQAHIARQLMAIRGDYVSLNYLKYLLITKLNLFRSEAKSLIPGIDRPMVLNIPVPLPSLLEQIEIVQKVESLMGKCKALESEIQTSDLNAQMLMQAVLKEAFEPAGEVEKTSGSKKEAVDV